MASTTYAVGQEFFSAERWGFCIAGGSVSIHAAGRRNGHGRILPHIRREFSETGLLQRTSGLRPRRCGVPGHYVMSRGGTPSSCGVK
jgi:hypothetical protein